MTDYSVNRKLCRLIESYPCLYDKSVPDYSNKECVRRAWVDIARVLNDTVSNTHDRWTKIRAGYSRSLEVDKYSDIARSRRKYYLHDELQFMKNVTGPTSSSLPIRVLTPREIDEQHENSRQSTEKSNEDCTFQITINQTPKSSSAQEKEERTDEKIKIIKSPMKKRSRTDFGNDLDDSPNLPDFQSRIKDYDFSFLENLLPDMKIMNAKQKIIFKKMVFQILEEVFSDTKDFPQKIEKIISNINGSTSLHEKMSGTKSVGTLTPHTSVVSPARTSHQQKETQTVVQLSPSLNAHVPKVVQTHNQTVVKDEIIDIYLED